MGLDMAVSVLRVGTVEGVLTNRDLSVHKVDLSHSVSLTPSPRGSLWGQFVQSGVKYEQWLVSA